MAPAGTPQPIVDRLHAEMKRITSGADFRAKALDLGLLPMDMPSIADTQTFIDDETTRWGALIRKIGLAGSQ